MLARQVSIFPHHLDTLPSAQLLLLAAIGKSLVQKSVDFTMVYARLSIDPVRQSVTSATSAMLTAAGVKKAAKVVKLAKTS